MNRYCGLGVKKSPPEGGDGENLLFSFFGVGATAAAYAILASGKAVVTLQASIATGGRLIRVLDGALRFLLVVFQLILLFGQRIAATLITGTVDGVLVYATRGSSRT